ncbi:hypothetical protein D3C84_606250 [compost metagenome]
MIALKRQLLATLDGTILSLGDLDVICEGEGIARSERLNLLRQLIEPNCSAELIRNLGKLNAVCRVLQEIGQCLDEKTGLHAITPFQKTSDKLQAWVGVIEHQLRASDPKPPGTLDKAPLNLPIAHTSELSQCGSREDVIKLLDSICHYYQHQEPSSPVPFLIARVRRLASMTFIEIIADLAPDAVNELHRLGGRKAE